METTTETVNTSTAWGTTPLKTLPVKTLMHVQQRKSCKTARSRINIAKRMARRNPVSYEARRSYIKNDIQTNAILKKTERRGTADKTTRHNNRKITNAVSVTTDDRSISASFCQIFSEVLNRVNFD